MNWTLAGLPCLLAIALVVDACSTSASPGGATCSTIEAEDTPSLASVRLVNNTAADIFVEIDQVPYCGKTPPFTVTDADQQSLQAFSLDPCTPSCSAVTCGCVMTVSCSANVVRIIPQGSVTVPWDGLVVQSRSMPTSCVPGQSCAGKGETIACDARGKPTAYPLTLSAQAGTGSGCTGSNCTCTPGTSGSCDLPGTYGSAPQGLTGKGTFAEGATSADIVFQ